MGYKPTEISIDREQIAHCGAFQCSDKTHPFYKDGWLSYVRLKNGQEFAISHSDRLQIEEAFRQNLKNRTNKSAQRKATRIKIKLAVLGLTRSATNVRRLTLEAARHADRFLDHAERFRAA